MKICFVSADGWHYPVNFLYIEKQLKTYMLLCNLFILLLLFGTVQQTQ